jgi:hypothetical protein
MLLATIQPPGTGARPDRLGMGRHRCHQGQRDCAVALSMSASSAVAAAMSTSSAAYSQCTCRQGRMFPHEPGSVLQGRQLNARPTLRLDNARQLEAEIMLLGLRQGPILRHLVSVARRPEWSVAHGHQPYPRKCSRATGRARSRCEPRCWCQRRCQHAASKRLRHGRPGRVCLRTGRPRRGS